MKELHGTGVALVTPFKSNSEVDYLALEKLVKHTLDGKVDYLVALGTTGETACLNTAEQQKIVEVIKQSNQERVPLVLGMGGNNTHALVDALQKTDLAGITAILSASPYYNKPTQEGIYQHYKLLSEISPLPIILYNVPGRTASNITAETTLRLANDFNNIIGIKEASADLDQVMEIIQQKPNEFLLISGEDGLTFPIIACGGEGVISVVANAFPKAFSEMVRLTKAEKLSEARGLHYKLKPLIDYLFAEGNPGGIKAALNELDICESNLRLPLWPISKSLESKIIDQVRKVGNL